jgi:hypothetical protein
MSAKNCSIAQVEQPGSLDSGVGIKDPNNKHAGVNYFLLLGGETHKWQLYF